MELEEIISPKLDAWIIVLPMHLKQFLILNFSSHFRTVRVANHITNTYFCQKKVMNTKLTLTIEKEVIEIAKEYAKEKGLSLSEMVENYFKLITVNRRKIKPKQISAKVRKLRGIINTNENLDYKQICY
jgi:replicative DNA helicase